MITKYCNTNILVGFLTPHKFIIHYHDMYFGKVLEQCISLDQSICGCAVMYCYLDAALKKVCLGTVPNTFEKY